MPKTVLKSRQREVKYNIQILRRRVRTIVTFGIVGFLACNMIPNQSTIRHHLALWKPLFPLLCWHHPEVKSVEQTCYPPAVTHSAHCAEWVVLCLIIISQGKGCSIRQIVIPQRWMVSIVPMYWSLPAPEDWHLPVKCCLYKSLVLIRMLIPEGCHPFHLNITCIASVYSASFLYPFIFDGSLMSLLTQGCLSGVFGSAVRITMADLPDTQVEKSLYCASSIVMGDSRSSAAV